MGYGRPPLGEILHAKFDVPVRAIDEVLALQRQKGGQLGEWLIRRNAASESMVLQSLAAQLDLLWMPSVDARMVDVAVLKKLPIAYVRRFRILPVRQQDGATLIAMTNPLMADVLDDLRQVLNQEVRVALTSTDVLIQALNEACQELERGTAPEVFDAGDPDSMAPEDDAERHDLLDAQDDAPVIRLVNGVLSKAVKQRASDIHVESSEKGLVIRYRIDGVLYPVLTPPRRLQDSILARLKIMADLNIAERRLPQDGRFTIRSGGKDVDLRVSVLPTSHGERIVLRLLEKGERLLNIADIGFSRPQLQIMRQLIQLSHGIILATGPTGSGKTTTLYGALSQINSPDKNILTIEDPVEYQLPGISQMQVNPKIELTFASGLRSILRQDPDVIMIGEIRDMETAEIAIHASLTGHLVFSTLHTNDAAGAITRLIDMGIEPFLVSSSLVAIVAQRLVRVICTGCRRPYTPSDEQLAQLGGQPGDHRPMLYRGTGCPLCAHTGYRGRTGIYELCVVSDEIRRLALAKSDAGAIQRAAVANGMSTLRDEGMMKARQGITTLDEVLRITQDRVDA